MTEQAEQLPNKAHRKVASWPEGLLRGGWALLTSPRTLAVTLALLVALACLGAIIPQASPALQPGSAEYEAWFSQVQSRWGTLASFAQATGLLRLFSTPFFRVVLAWIAALCLAQLAALFAPVLPHMRGRSASWSGTCDGDAGRAWARIDAALVAVGLQTARPVEIGSYRVAVVRRAGPRGWLPSLVYLGVLALLLASLVGWRWGWRAADVTLLLGETQSLDARRGLSARLDEVRLTPGTGANPMRVASQAALLRDGQPVADVQMDAGHGARYDGISLYQVGDGPALRLSVRDAQGQLLDITDTEGVVQPRPVARLAFSGSQQEHLVVAPAADLVLHVVHYPSLPSQGIAGRALYVQLARWSDGSVLLERTLDGDATLSVPAGAGELLVQVAFERYVVLRVEREPETPLAALGGLLALVGVTSALLWPQRRAWLILRAGDDELCALRLDVAAHDARRPWVSCLRAALGLQEVRQ